MKVSKRDMTLLTLLAVIGFVYVLYTLLFKPMFADISTAKAGFETVSQQKATLDNSASLIDKLKISQDKAILTATSDAAIFLPDLTKSKIVNFMNAESAKFGMTIVSLNLNDPAVVDTTATSATTNQSLTYPLGLISNQVLGSNTSGAASTSSSPITSSAAVTSNGAVSTPTDRGNTPSVLQMKVQITFANVTYANIMALLKDIENTHRAIYLESLSLQAQQNSNLLAVSITFGFTSVGKVSDTDPGLPMPPNYPQAGKADPFA